MEVGDIFKVSCEAIGNPIPRIRWFKDGQEIKDSVVPREKSPSGTPKRSSVELQVLGTVDAGVYTCAADNGVGGVRYANYTLNVDLGSASASQHAVVTEAGPANSTVVEGDIATLRCKVKSTSRPHIKWLKKLDNENEQGENILDEIQQKKVVNVYTLNKGNQQYRVLDTKPDKMTENGEYLNILEIPDAKVKDSGLYICFVTNSGFGALTYKSAFLRVLPRALVVNNNHSVNKGTSDSLLLALIIALVGVTFVVGVILVICVLRRSRKPPKEAANSRQERQRPIGPEEEDRMIQQRPFLMGSSSTEMKFEAASPSSLPPPPPLYPPSQWSRTVYPAYPFPHYENPNKLRAESPNQYEVPYSHLLQVQPKAKSVSNNSSNNSSLNPLLQYNGRCATFTPNGNVTTFGGSRTNKSDNNDTQQQPQNHPPAAVIYPFRSHPYFQYLNDYET